MRLSTQEQTCSLDCSSNSPRARNLWYGSGGRTLHYTPSEECLYQLSITVHSLNYFQVQHIDSGKSVALVIMACKRTLPLPAPFTPCSMARSNLARLGPITSPLTKSLRVVKVIVKELSPGSPTKVATHPQITQTLPRLIDRSFCNPSLCLNPFNHAIQLCKSVRFSFSSNPNLRSNIPASQ